MTFDHFCDRIVHLNQAQVNGTRMPYKPLLFAAVVTLIHKRKIPTPDVLLDGGLQSASSSSAAARPIASSAR